MLAPEYEHYHFPPATEASAEGLLAIGGDLSVGRLLSAYRQGIFPWFNEGQPILWWSPDPRVVLYPDKFKVSRSFKKSLRNKSFYVTFDQVFDRVVTACAAPRIGHSTPGTWITEEMRDAYGRLHSAGYAHSVETWRNRSLVGGLYGVSIGKCFFGESMFSIEPDTSKIALYHLVRQLQHWQFPMIDCQLPSKHLFSLGAQEISRARFLRDLVGALSRPAELGSWSGLSARGTGLADEWQVP